VLGFGILCQLRRNPLNEQADVLVAIYQQHSSRFDNLKRKKQEQKGFQIEIH